MLSFCYVNSDSFYDAVLIPSSDSMDKVVFDSQPGGVTPLSGTAQIWLRSLLPDESASASIDMRTEG